MGVMPRRAVCARALIQTTVTKAVEEVDDDIQVSEHQRGREGALFVAKEWKMSSRG